MIQAKDTNELSDESLVCRDLRHAWEITDQTVTQTKELIRTVWCHRCGTSRIDHFSWPTLTRTGTTYTYPDRYQLSQSPHRGRTTVTDIRVEWYKRHKLPTPRKQK